MTNFTMVENEIFDYNISGQAFRLYCLLKSYCFNGNDRCFPSQNTLAKKLNKSIRTVQRNLKELVTAGIITIKRRGSISNIYVLLTVKSTSKGEPISFNKTSKRNKSVWNPAYNKIDSFNNYEQRNYNYEKLEAALLGNIHVGDNMYEILK